VTGARIETEILPMVLVGGARRPGHVTGARIETYLLEKRLSLNLYGRKLAPDFRLRYEFLQ
jgi:hypothetical protein